jgi:hypothetical protein
MSDSLRTRIAGLQQMHIPIDYAGYIECSCGVECKPDHGGIDVAEQMWGEHVADAVIAALGLCEEFGALDDQDGGVLADAREELLPLYPKETIKRRFITDWEAHG